MLAYLALHPGEAVSADRLLDEVWGDDLSDTGARAVAFQISKLRSVLEPAVSTASMLAVAAHELGQHETAAVLFGFVAADRARLDIVPRPCDRPRVERAIAACRAALGEDRFDELAARGVGMEFRDLPRPEISSDDVP